MAKFQGPKTGFRAARKDGIAIVQPGCHKSMNESFSLFERQEFPGFSDVSQMEESSLCHIWNVGIEGQIFYFDRNKCCSFS